MNHEQYNTLSKPQKERIEELYDIDNLKASLEGANDNLDFDAWLARISVKNGVVFKEDKPTAL